MNSRLELKLVKGAKGGDLECFGRLCENYYGRLTAVAYSIVGDHHLAEDAVQASFAKAITSLGALRCEDKFGAWMARICRNTAKSMAVKNSRQFTRSDLSEVRAAEEKDDNTWAVKQAIEMLSAAEKEIVCLRYYGQLSYQEIGVMLELSTAAVNGRLKRAKEKISENIKRMNIPEMEI